MIDLVAPRHHAPGREDLVAELQRARTRIAAGMREIAQTSPVPAASASNSGKRRGRPENVAETKRRSAVLERVHAGEITNAEAAKEVGISYGAWSAWKSIQGKRNGVIVPAPTVRAEAASNPIRIGKHRGRPSDPVETARRAAVLERVHTGELSNAQAAAELGITYAAWSGWRTYQGQRNGVVVQVPTVRASSSGVVVPAKTVRATRTRNKTIATAPAARAARTPDVSELVARIERVERFGAELRRRVRELVAFVEERTPR